MPEPNRKQFRGSACGLACRIRRPQNVIIPAQAATSIPVTGGVGEALATNGNFHEGRILFDRLYTRIEGDFLDAAGSVNYTYGNWNANPSPMKTTIRVEGEGLTVINAGPSSTDTMDIDAYSFTLTSITRSNAPSEVTTSGIALTGLRLNGSELRVTFSEAAFNQYNTLNSIAAAYENNDDFYSAYGSQFFPPVPTSGGSPRMFPSAYGNTAATMVEKIEWVGAPLPSVTIDGNTIVFPGFGVIHLGEVNLTRFDRSITMVRLELGSPDGGDYSSGSGTDGGHEYP